MKTKKPGRDRTILRYVYIANLAGVLYKNTTCWATGVGGEYPLSDPRGLVKREMFTDSTWSVFIRGEDCKQRAKDV